MLMILLVGKDGLQAGVQGYFNKKLKKFKFFKKVEDALEAPNERLSTGQLPKSPRGNGSYEAEGDFGAFNQSPKDTKTSGKLRNKPPSPLKEADGRPHSMIEKPGKDGQYTTHNDDGT
ncbi:hypothetical protein PSSHI_31140 [Photobacterium sp. R1]